MYYPYGQAAGWACPAPIAVRSALISPAAPGRPLVHAAGALPIYGGINPFQYGATVIDPGELYFSGGHAIGGPSEGYRGVRAARFPSIMAVGGSGAPLSPEALGLAGVHIIGNGPWTGGVAI